MPWGVFALGCTTSEAAEWVPFLAAFPRPRQEKSKSRSRESSVVPGDPRCIQKGYAKSLRLSSYSFS